MTTRNIVISGMTGGAGHVGIVTQGFGGVYAEPELIIAGFVTLRFAAKEVVLDLADKVKSLKFGRKGT